MKGYTSSNDVLFLTCTPLLVNQNIKSSGLCTLSDSLLNYRAILVCTCNTLNYLGLPILMTPLFYPIELVNAGASITAFTASNTSCYATTVFHKIDDTHIELYGSGQLAGWGNASFTILGIK